jgi:hypothetical protein
MILKFNLNKCLAKYKKHQLEPWAVNPDAHLYIDRWIKFALDLRGSHYRHLRTSFSFIDRTGAVPSVVNTYLPEDQKIPLGPPKHMDFLDNCLSRAQEFLDTGKQINVLWSGGLDSTVMLFSLLRQAQHRDQVNVMCTFESILESGSMFDSFVKNAGVRIKFDQTKLEYHLPYSYDHEDTTQLYVTGECGDQLFSPPFFCVPANANRLDPWQQWATQDFLNIVEPSIKFSERPIETVRDLSWWTMFNHTWTTVLYDELVGLPAQVAQRIHPFYGTSEFQRWAIHTPTYYQHIDQYRWAEKQALAQLIDYPYYQQHKRKNLSATWFEHPSWYMLDKNFKVYADPA